MADAPITARRELAAFLRGRREGLAPHGPGLPPRRGPRRTPGLRREEVADLAGVSTDYVVRLEQARELRPSAEVVGALARALQLDPQERAYVFGLARQRPRDADEPATEVAPSLAAMLADLSSQPAMVLNHRFDVLAWNDLMARLMLDFGALPSEQRNAVWLCLAHPGLRERYVDPDGVVRDGIALLRAARATHPEDEALDELVAECLAANDDVARLWSDDPTEVRGHGSKAIRHPEVGLLTTDFEVLAPLGSPDHVVVIHRAADDDSRRALDRLLGR